MKLTIPGPRLSYKSINWSDNNKAKLYKKILKLNINKYKSY